jgi:5-methylcytosine-specific restriction endonuclease McrA
MAAVGGEAESGSRLDVGPATAPASGPGSEPASAAEIPPQASRSERPVIAPLSPERYKIQFTASEPMVRKLEQIQELLRHQVPNGDPAVIVDQALTLLLEKLLKEKTGAVTKPRQGKRTHRPAHELRRERVAAGKPTESRHIPAEVKRAVWLRDQGRCAFKGTDGHRCRARGMLEFHHVEPYTLGGKATIENIALRCRTHNAYEGRLQFPNVRIAPNNKPNSPRGEFVAPRRSESRT